MYSSGGGQWGVGGAEGESLQQAPCPAQSLTGLHLTSLRDQESDA